MDAETTKAVASATGEIGKATAEAAKLGGQVVVAGSAFGGWLKSTLGTIPEDLLGVAGGDWLHHKRRRNLLTLEMNTEVVRRRIGAVSVEEPSPSVIIPLLKAASDEGRPELQQLWAALLVSAMQPDGGTRVRRAYFDTLQRMEPTDARLFQAVAALGSRYVGYERADGFAAGVGLVGSEAAVSWQALQDLGLIRQNPDGSRGATAYGLTFWRACTPSQGG